MGPNVTVYLTCACHHWSGWARCDQNVDLSGSNSARLLADVPSHLSGSSAIQPLAASEESCHRVFFWLLFLYLFFVFFKLFSLREFESCYVPLQCLWKESNVKTEKN